MASKEARPPWPPSAKLNEETRAELRSIAERADVGALYGELTAMVVGFHTNLGMEDLLQELADADPHMFRVALRQVKLSTAPPGKPLDKRASEMLALFIVDSERTGIGKAKWCHKNIIDDVDDKKAEALLKRLNRAQKLYRQDEHFKSTTDFVVDRAREMDLERLSYLWDRSIGHFE